MFRLRNRHFRAVCIPLDRCSDLSIQIRKVIVSGGPGGSGRSSPKEREKTKVKVVIIGRLKIVILATP